MIDIFERLTFSRMDLAEQDPTAFVLPWSNWTNEHASFGTIVHRYLEEVPRYGFHAALARVPAEHRTACAMIDLDALPASKPDMYSAEVSFAYNVDTGEAREIGRNIGRAYAGLLRDREIAGTLDVLGVTDDAVIYPDYKTGIADLGPVRENWQLRIGILAAARTYGKTIGHPAIVHVKPNGESYWDKATLNELDLDATEHAVRRIVARIERAVELHAKGEPPSTNEGEHCKYCPAFSNCPAKKNLALALAGGDPLLPEVLNEQTAPLVFARLKAVQQVIDHVWKSLDEYAAVTPIPLEDGYVYGARQKPRFTIDPEKAPKVLESLGLSVAPEVKKTITGKALEAALRAHLKGSRGITKAVEAAEAALLDAGAATRVHHTTVERHRPKPAALPATTTQQPEEPNAPQH